MSRFASEVNSLQALKGLLQEIIVSPKQFFPNENLIKALSSQGGLAKYSDSSRAILPTSLNTLKRKCADTVPGGFNELDKLRKRALITLQQQALSTSKSPRNRKNELVLKNENLLEQNQLLKEELLSLTMLFEKSLQQGLSYAGQADSAIMAICKKEQRELLGLFNSRRRAKKDD